MRNILLVSVNHNNLPSMTLIYENMGILYIEASLKNKGYTCSIIDGTAYGLSYEITKKEILHNLPSLFIGFSVFINNLENTINMIKNIRKEGFKGHITMGGMWPGFKYREILEQIKEVDSVCVGEGEELIGELAEFISKGKSLSNIKGLATRDENNNILFTERRFQDNIDLFPVPDRRGYYLDIIKKKERIDILFSRGCHLNCSFCNISSYIKLCGGKRWRCRNPESVINEIEYLMNTTGVNTFEFIDDNFLGPSEKEREKCLFLAEEIIRRNLNIKFAISSRVEGVEYKLFKKLKEAGLTFVNLGVESFVKEQLERYNKRVSPKQNLEALQILDELNIPYFSFIVLLDPYVTREEIKENLDIIKKVGLKHIHNTHFARRILLNQYLPLFKKCLEDNLIKNFAVKSLYNNVVDYSQFHSDTECIIDAASAVDKLFYTCLDKLFITQIHSLQWDRIEREITEALKSRLFSYFCEYVHSNCNEEGSKFIYSKMSSAYENICSFCEKITGKDIIELKEYIIDIDGIKISTRPEGLNEIITKIMERSKND